MVEIVRGRLREQEAKVRNGLLALGTALKKIRDERLYREEYATFEQYCQERWGFRRFYAHRQIEAAEVIELLPNWQQTPNEGQARELAPVAREDPERAVEIWAEVVEETGGRPTARAIRERVAPETVEGGGSDVVRRRGPNVSMQWHDLVVRALDIALGLREAGGFNEGTRRWPEQNRRILAQELHRCGELLIELADEYQEVLNVERR
jgi:hypothetical protein